MEHMKWLSNRQRSALLFIVSFLVLMMCCWSAVHLSSFGIALYNYSEHQSVETFVITFEILGVLSGITLLLSAISVVFDNLGSGLEVLQLVVIIVTTLAIGISFVACCSDLLIF